MSCRTNKLCNMAILRPTSVVVKILLLSSPAPFRCHHNTERQRASSTYAAMKSAMGNYLNILIPLYLNRLL